ncbi:MAG: hypothetical protein ACOX5Z_13175 [Desulfobulbus sp.]|jgi:hypothetical protein
MPVSPLLATGLFVFVCILVLSARLFVLHRRDQHELAAQRAETARRIQGLQSKIETALNDDDTFDRERTSFAAALHNAGLTTDLQRPRLEAMSKREQQPPDKYRIISALADQDMQLDEIAHVLRVSRMEAEQLLRLSVMARSARQATA